MTVQLLALAPALLASGRPRLVSDRCSGYLKIDKRSLSLAGKTELRRGQESGRAGRQAVQAAKSCIRKAGWYQNGYQISALLAL
jgi:hypothetical protein